jgi:FtsP/CotA-like multicopper oxidase with cupredoxin domain
MVYRAYAITTGGRMSKRKLAIGILVGAAALVLGACSGVQARTAAPTAQTSTSTPVPGIASPSGAHDYRSSAALSTLTVKLNASAEIKPTGRVREFQLVATRAPWEIAPGKTVQAITYNGTVPGPTLRVTEGDTVKVTLKNELDQDTTIHWHGLHVPNSMDGVPPFSQDPIKPGQTFTYEFVASHAGTFMYHPHTNSVEQIDNGLYGLLVIDPQTPDEPAFDQEFSMMLSAWSLPSQSAMDSSDGQAMPGMAHGAAPADAMGGMNMNYNWFTINGKAFPATPEWVVKPGDVVRVRIVNISNLAHPMHLHGHDFKVVAKDGEPLAPALQQTMNTLNVAPGETYDIVFVANNPGTWVFHCHELHHTENDGVEPGGLMQVIRYEGSTAPVTSPAQPQPTPTMPSSMPGMKH